MFIKIKIRVRVKARVRICREMNIYIIFRLPKLLVKLKFLHLLVNLHFTQVWAVTVTYICI